MFMFWVATGAMAAVAAGLILFRARGAASPGMAADPAPLLYRRQLAEIDELADRGLLGAAEQKNARAEAARRLLAAAGTQRAAWTAGATGRAPVVLAVLAALTLALGLYLVLGSPGFRDQPYEKRLAAWRHSPLESLSAPEIAAVLRQVTAERPNDPEGMRLLALAEGASQDAPAAVRAMRRAVALAPERADLWRMFGEALVFQAGGKVEADAQAAFREALKRDRTDIAARFYLAQADAEAGRTAEAAAEFEAVLAALPAGDERRRAVEAALARAEGAPGPARFSAEQMAAIRGMVEGLAQRLQQNPEDADGWVRLVRAYAVLGEMRKRDAALKSARAHYAGDADVLEQLEDAARAAAMQ